MTGKNYFITTAIDYVNTPPHIGHALEKIQADVLARFYREQGCDVYFQTGVDEHGIKIARASEAAGKKPEDFVNEISQTFKDLKGHLNLSWDAFIRTTDKNIHWPKVLEIWKRLDESGDLYKKKYRGLYCVGHEAFVTDKDLQDGMCVDHKKTPEIIEEENWFFSLSRYSKQIESMIEKDELSIVPKSRKNEILTFIKEGLQDVSFSRPSKDLSWGIPVPNEPTQTIYVWADALTNYLDNGKWWPANAHIIGKDILRFHAAIWPGMLLSAGLEMPKSILVHGFITVDGEKMSKTVGNVINPIDLVKKYGVDAVRYYLLREIPTTEDGDFSIAKFEARYNGDLANGLGNFTARTLALTSKVGKLKNITPQKEILKEARELSYDITIAVENFMLHEALAIIWRLISYGDKYISKHKPWKTNDPIVIYNALYILEKVGELLIPFLPETSQKILESTKSLSVNKAADKKTLQLFPKISPSTKS